MDDWHRNSEAEPKFSFISIARPTLLLFILIIIILPLKSFPNSTVSSIFRSWLTLRRTSDHQKLNPIPYCLMNLVPWIFSTRHHLTITIADIDKFSRLTRLCYFRRRSCHCWCDVSTTKWPSLSASALNASTLHDRTFSTTLVSKKLPRGSWNGWDSHQNSRLQYLGHGKKKEFFHHKKK